MNEVVAADLAKVRSEITTALEGGEIEHARGLVEDAIRRWPRDYRLRMQEAEVLHRSHEPAAAVERYLALGREGHERHWPLLRAIRILCDSGDIAQAREIFAAEVWTGSAPQDVKLRGLAWLATAADESEALAAYLERLAAAPAPAPAVDALAKLAELRARQGREEQARDALARIGSLDAAPLRALAVEADLLLAEGRVAELLPLARKLAADEPDRIDHARRLSSALFLSGDTREGIDTLIAALDRWPGDWVLQSRFNVLPIDRQRTEQVIASTMQRIAPATLPEISRFQIALTLLDLGRTEDALRLLAGIAADGAVGPMANPLRRVLETMPAEAWRQRSRLDDDRTAELQLVQSPGARTAILVFGGTTGGYSHLPCGHVDALLADLPAHVVYVRDTSGRGFLGGSKSVDGPQARIVAGLRRILADLNVERTVALGASIGGHAAARMGAALGADAVAVIAAPTTFDNAPIAGERASPYNRLHRIRRLAAMFASADVDLLNHFADHPRTRNYYYFGAGTERGERNASRLHGIDNVVLRALPIADHTALPLDIIGTRFWDQLLQEDLRVAG